MYYNFQVTKIVGDGRCLFRSVAQGSCLQFDNRFWSMKSPDQIEADQCQMADTLRMQVADELLRRREESQWFVAGSLDAYVERLRQPRTFGGELELLMLSHVLRHPITVYTACTVRRRAGDGRGVVVLAEYGQEEYGRGADSRRIKKSIKVLYDRLKRHYEALQVFPPRRPPLPRRTRSPALIRAQRGGSIDVAVETEAKRRPHQNRHPYY